MSEHQTPKNGRNTGGGLNALFDIAKVEKGTNPKAKAIMVKLSPTTDIHAMVTEVNRRIPHMSPMGIVRLLIKAGYVSFARSESARSEA